MQQISVVIITYNESIILEKTLKAAAQVANEIIIVDSGSTDSTLEIAQKFDAKIVHQPWIGFGPQKKVGVAHAMHQYILAIDADEVLSDALIKEIKVAQNGKMADAYQMQFSNYYFGKFLKYGMEHPLKKIRLFNKQKINWDDKQVHESLIIAPESEIAHFKNYIHHYTYHTIEQYLLKANHYTTIGANALFSKGKKASISKIVFSPIFTFIKSYFFKRGFLDGLHGFIVAIFNAHTNFLKYVKLWNLNNKHSND
jgi:glycosyltransferase involved in cell wall biosynthesis